MYPGCMYSEYMTKDDDHKGVDYDDLNYYQWGDPLLNHRAGEVLAWGLKLLKEGSFERGD